jgi:hypothetical protein
LRKFEIIHDFEVQKKHIEEWLKHDPIPETIDFQVQYKTHYNTLKEFLRIEGHGLETLLKHSNAIGLLGEAVGDLILRQDFEFRDPKFRHKKRIGTYSGGGTMDVEIAFPKKKSRFYSLGEEFTLDYKAHKIKCLEHGKYRSPEISLPQRRYINSQLATDKKVLILSLSFCDCERIFCKYLLVTQRLGLFVKTRELRHKFIFGSLPKDFIEIWVRQRTKKMDLTELELTQIVKNLDDLYKKYQKEIEPLKLEIKSSSTRDRLLLDNQKKLIFAQWHRHESVNISKNLGQLTNETKVLTLIVQFLQTIKPR